MALLSVGLGLLGRFSRPASHHRADRLSGSLRTSFSGHVPSPPCPRPIYIIARTYSQPVRIPRHTYVTDHITTSHFSSMRTSSSSSLCLLLPGCEWASIFDLLIVTRIFAREQPALHPRAPSLLSSCCSSRSLLVVGLLQVHVCTWEGTPH